jgi:hypothetical protein
MAQKVKVNYDLKSLIKPQEVDDKPLNDEQFLNLQRKRAESKLIKTKIIYKLT